MARLVHGRCLAGVGLALALAGCASAGGGRIENGVYHSPKGYRIALPGPGWMPVTGGHADLALTQPDARAGILVNASCDARAVRRPGAALARQLLLGFRERGESRSEEVSVNGRAATHEVLEGALGAAAPPVKVELYVMKDGRCVYDLLYVAPPDAFDARRAEFQRFVATFAIDAPGTR